MSEGKTLTDTEARRAARRAAMPITTALLAEYAEWGATVVYACENGITVGKKPCEQSDNVLHIPPNYRPMWTPREKKK
jgi:hypothetical protein